MDAALEPRTETDFSGVYEKVVGVLEEGVAVFDGDGLLLTCNPAAERLLELELSQLKGQKLTGPQRYLVDENGVALIPEHPVYTCFHSGQAEAFVLGLHKPSGAFSWLRVNAQPLEQSGVVSHVAVSFVDITEQRETQQRLEREAFFRATLIEVVTESLHQGLDERFYQRLLACAVRAIPGAQAGSLLLFAEGRYEFTAAVGYDLPALQQTYLLPEEMYRGDDAYKLVLAYGFDNTNVAEERRRVIESVGRADEIQVCMSIPVVLNGQAVAYFSLDNFQTKDAFSREATEMGHIFAQQTAALWQRFRLEAATERLAFYDVVTNLPNRRLFYDRLAQALAQRRKGEALAVMFLDLDDFKNVNDTFGHDAGDVLLQSIAQRLAGVVRHGDTLARWGGDEFVLAVQLNGTKNNVAADDCAVDNFVADNCAKDNCAADAAAVADKLLEVLAEPFLVSGRALQVEGSIGIDLLYAQPKSADELVKHADIALYRAKALGKNSYQFFTPELQRHLQARLELERDLRGALQRHELTLDYQPRFDLETGAVTSAEALVRWRRPEHGPVSPAEFIPVAEATGLILPLGDQVLSMAVQQAKLWQDAGNAWRVAVNVSAKQLACSDFAGNVQKELAAHALDPGCLELEITESAAVENLGDTAAQLRELRHLGVRVALDDFGTAYSSLTQLKRLPLDVLKIDQAFIRDLASQPEAAESGTAAETCGAEIVKTVIALGRSLGLVVVAEGVETRAQLELLRSLGCHEVQGYYLARPQPAAALASTFQTQAGEPNVFTQPAEHCIKL